MAENEAELCSKLALEYDLSPQTVLYYDFEYDTIENASRHGIVLGSKQCNEFTKAFCNRCKDRGFRSGFYTNIDYYRNMYSSDTKFLYGDTIWLADYSKNSTSAYSCVVRQTSSTGKIYGIRGNVDLDTLYSNEESDDYMTDAQFQERFEKAFGAHEEALRAMDNPGEWSKDAREFCVDHKIFNGTKMPDGSVNYMWNATMTREEAAQLFYNVLKDKI